MMTPSRDPRIDGILARLVQRGVIPSTDDVRVEPLPGGVSADVFAVTVGDRRLVVKQALRRLRVAQEWLSDPARVIVEAEAIAFARRVRPDNVPEVVDIDDELFIIAMTRAPAGMENWKSELLAGVIDPIIAGSIGTALADWHSESNTDREVLSRFHDRRHFLDLRVSPFFQRVAEVHEDLGERIGGVIERMDRSICLVHGDFSPKNILVKGPSFWVIDWEIAHIGDPTFDLAFLVSHLACKAIHRPSDAAGYRACADAFLAGYLERSVVTVVAEDLVAQIGCLLLARVDGKSPVDYFDAGQKQEARALGRRMLCDQGSELEDLWGPR